MDQELDAISSHTEYPFVPQQIKNYDELKAKFKNKQKRPRINQDG